MMMLIISIRRIKIILMRMLATIYIYIWYAPPPMDLPFSCVSEPHHTKIVDP